jgi:predicted exporter
MVSIEEQIAAIKEREAQLKARRQKLTAKIGAKERKERERRLYLYGLALEAARNRGDLQEEQLVAWLDQAIIRDWDREFLGLKPKV